ncbi:DUF305 domain-containing protein [Mycetocola miduiensis]|uniref:Uncharacterized conserved protein, DUF305 family n=1 Tax=Mycetocola miduiensis TaxID=995034 RepID=A0A1I5AHN3_9MICO|nr:DUF305 domain-containing protein [Mycetocola miduiensis]SFN61945.1 Uncharacterized conserved protein, DUF305 family [Mycetocola miduiensis]
MNPPRRYALAAATFALAITLSACSTAGNDDSPEQEPAPAPSSDAVSGFNDADVVFAQMMVPHHEQAVEMSDMLLAKDGIDAQVVSLATQVKDAQQPEIEQLNEWLDAWGADDNMAGMDHGAGGMMSNDDMMALDGASGAEASQLFLEQMIVHHEGAVEMAETEINDGVNADAIEMAGAIVLTQSEEINVMRNLLGSL